MPRALPAAFANSSSRIHSADFLDSSHGTCSFAIARLQVSPFDLGSGAQRADILPDPPFRAKLRLFGEKMLVESLEGKWREKSVAVLSLRFEYCGIEVRPRNDQDDLDEFACADVERDELAESRVQALIERSALSSSTTSKAWSPLMTPERTTYFPPTETCTRSVRSPAWRRTNSRRWAGRSKSTPRFHFVWWRESIGSPSSRAAGRPGSISALVSRSRANASIWRRR